MSLLPPPPPPPPAPLLTVLRMLDVREEWYIAPGMHAADGPQPRLHTCQLDQDAPDELIKTELIFELTQL
jgi:hypothetical protein